MTTTFDPQFGPQAQPQQFYAPPAPAASGGPAVSPAASYTSATAGWTPVPQIDSYPPQPQYRPAQAAWSQPGYAAYPPDTGQPSWQQSRPASNRTTVIAIVAAVVLLLAGGTVALILALGGDKAAPAAPSAPQIPGSQLPHQPANYPQLPQAPADGPATPTEPPATSGPTAPVDEPEQPTVEPQNQDAGPGQAAAEQVAGSFVGAMRAGAFDTAQTYLCSAKSDGFADRAAQAATQIDLESMTLAGVTVTGNTGEMVMQYAMAGQTRKLHETLPMVVEQGSWKVCN